MNLAEPITSLADPRAQRIADLAKPSHSNTKVALIEDAEPLANALRAGVGFIEVCYEQGHPVTAELEDLLAQARVPVAVVEGAILTRLFRTDKRPRLFGIAKVPRPSRLEALLERPGDVVVLDGVRIVGNIGAIVRTATAFGAAGLALIDSGLATIADRRLLRASRGYVFSLPVVLTEANELARFLGDEAIPITVLDADGASTLAELARRPGRRALVFGNERKGPSASLRGAAPEPAIRQDAPGGPITPVQQTLEAQSGRPERDSAPDRLSAVAIPMPGPVESLNVSVAVAVTLYALTAWGSSL
ncbi:MAG: NshR/TsnR family 23S rRNA methyltransferase [Bifidobacteriaceae bacterium]|nr:NshR/TsnR family 23S rRNA methyltransferase [Bifidobacteriaceae bacterium]